MTATHEQMVEEVLTWGSDKDRGLFALDKKENLIAYHHSLGRAIRNHFKLWAESHEPEILNGVDMSKNHPDYRSQRVIEAVWERLQE